MTAVDNFMIAQCQPANHDHASASFAAACTDAQAALRGVPMSAQPLVTLSAYDLRLRSLDGDGFSSCACGWRARWSVWLHTPEWGTGEAGLTRVVCTGCALALVSAEAHAAVGDAS